MTSDIVPTPLIIGKNTPSVNGDAVPSISIFGGSVFAYPDPPAKTSISLTPY